MKLLVQKQALAGMFLISQLLLVSFVILEVVVLGFFSLIWALMSPWFAPVLFVVVCGTFLGSFSLVHSVWREFRRQPIHASKFKIVLLLLGMLSGLGPSWFWYIQMDVNHNFSLLTIAGLSASILFVVVSGLHIFRLLQHPGTVKQNDPQY